MLQPFLTGEATGDDHTKYPSPATLRAGAANYFARGVDGIYTWYMQWPLGDAERRVLTELGDREAIAEGDKHYILRTALVRVEEMGYGSHLPVEIPVADPRKTYSISFFVADDLEAVRDRIRQVRLVMDVKNLVSADDFVVELNGKSLASETCLRTFESRIRPFRGQKLEYHLEDIRPRKGENVLTVALKKRPEDFGGGVTITKFELLLEYGAYPSTLKT